MKQLWQVMMKDFQGECFTRKDFLTYGILVPLMFIIMLALVNVVDTMIMSI